MKATTNYQNGKIYKITSTSTIMEYYGSTCQEYLSQRLTAHKSAYKRWKDGNPNYTTSFEILKFNDYNIQLLELFPCSCKDELTAREAYYIKINKDIAINKVIPGRTMKEYRYANRDKINVITRKCYQNNIEKRQAYDKKRWIDNLARRESQKVHFDCECGGKYQATSKARHFNTIKHQEWLNTQSSFETHSLQDCSICHCHVSAGLATSSNLLLSSSVI